MSRPPAGIRLRRLLALLPWLADHPGATVDEVGERFDVSREQLLADLDVVWMVGVPPYTPDQLLEVHIDDDRISVVLGSFFRRPLRLTPAQALALVAAGQSLLAVPGSDGDGPLARGLAKVATALQVDPDDAVAVHLGAATAQTLDRLRTAIRTGHRVRLDYYSFSSDERSARDVDPHRVWAEGGSWYLGGHCHRAGGARVFRLDRIAAVEVLDEVVATTAEPDAVRFSTGDAEARVSLDLEPEAAWVADYYPNDGVEDLDDGRVRVHLPVAGERWLEQLLVRLGPAATVVDRRGDLPVDPAGAAARRILARYGR